MRLIDRKKFIDILKNNHRFIAPNDLSLLKDIKEALDEAEVLPRIFYICDKKACDDECPNPSCNATLDIRHAKHFDINSLGDYFEIGCFNEFYSEGDKK